MQYTDGADAKCCRPDAGSMTGTWKGWIRICIASSIRPPAPVMDPGEAATSGPGVYRSASFRNIRPFWSIRVHLLVIYGLKPAHYTDGVHEDAATWFLLLSVKSHAAAVALNACFALSLCHLTVRSNVKSHSPFRMLAIYSMYMPQMT